MVSTLNVYERRLPTCRPKSSKVKGKVAEIDNTLGKRKLWGSVVIGLFILAGVIFLLVRKAYEEEGG